MGRLVVISNRTANLGKNTQIGGLAVGIVDALKAQGGLWAGWDGSVVDAEETATTKIQTHGNVTSLTIPTDERGTRKILPRLRQQSALARLSLSP